MSMKRGLSIDDKFDAGIRWFEKGNGIWLRVHHLDMNILLLDKV